jgi:hypothetical protein
MTSESDVETAIQAALLLCIAQDTHIPRTIDWLQVYAAAHAERLAVVAWLRNGDNIRRSAPSQIVARWRTEVLAAHELAQIQLRAIERLAAALSTECDDVLILKGLPLAERLYGHIAARACCDIDLYVPPVDRVRADESLRNAGWHHWYGKAPFDASYRKECEGSTIFLEIHSALTGEPLGHCQIPVSGNGLWTHAEMRWATLDGPEFVVYLAANLAKRAMPPLLGFLDLSESWALLDAASRAESVDVARAAGLARCLEWALRRAHALPAATTGEPDALNLLGVAGDQRRSVHACLRLAMLADTPIDASRVIGAWLWPRSLRGAGRSLPAFWRRRLARPFARRFVYARTYADDRAS